MGLGMIYIEEEKYRAPHKNFIKFEVDFFRPRWNALSRFIHPLWFLGCGKESWPLRWSRMNRDAQEISPKCNNKCSSNCSLYSHILYNLTYYEVWVLPGGCSCWVIWFWLGLLMALSASSSIHLIAQLVILHPLWENINFWIPGFCLIVFKQFFYFRISDSFFSFLSTFTPLF